MRKINLFIKRLFDILLSCLGLFLLSPILIISILGIKITMPGPVFFSQERIGKFGIPFRIYKLRTLKVDREAENERDMSKDDKRRTMWGELLRRCKIDEIPQAINVIIGHMSIVGPRPTVAEHVVLYDSMEKHRLDMRPGITGLAQVNGNGSLIWEDRIAYDLEYIKDFNIFLDIIIMIKTIGVVIMGEDKFCKPKSNVSKENSKYYW